MGCYGIVLEDFSLYSEASHDEYGPIYQLPLHHGRFIYALNNKKEEVRKAAEIYSKLKDKYDLSWTTER